MTVSISRGCSGKSRSAVSLRCQASQPSPVRPIQTHVRVSEYVSRINIHYSLKTLFTLFKKFLNFCMHVCRPRRLSTVVISKWGKFWKGNYPLANLRSTTAKSLFSIHQSQMLACKIFSIPVNSMPDERTKSGNRFSTLF